MTPGATRLALLGACPWLPYFAPLALRTVNSELSEKVGAVEDQHRAESVGEWNFLKKGNTHYGNPSVIYDRHFTDQPSSG